MTSNTHPFICPKCGVYLEGLRPEQCCCGYVIPVKDGILQFTDMPDMVIESECNNYIGYEHIGKYYSGYDGSYKISDDDKAIAKYIKEIIKEGILLDLGCGDGLITIPLALERVNVIAGDISNGMMKLLEEKATLVNANMSRVTLARMNALSFPLADNSIHAVIANSMLHLNSNPQRIIDEIYRVLKPDGIYLCFNDKPNQEIIDEEFKKSKFIKLINEIHSLYFGYLKQLGIYGKRLSWSFNRDTYCLNMFTQKKVISIRETPKKVTNKLSDFTRRLGGRGFSDQSAVPDDIHKEVFSRVDKEIRAAYGDEYKQIQYDSYDNGLEMILYMK